MFELTVKPMSIKEPTFIILSPTRSRAGLWAVSSIALVMPGMVETVSRSEVMNHLRSTSSTPISSSNSPSSSSSSSSSINEGLLAGFKANEMKAMELFVGGLDDMVEDLHVVRFSMMCDVRHLHLNMHSVARYMGRPMTEPRNCGVWPFLKSPVRWNSAIRSWLTRGKLTYI